MDQIIQNPGFQHIAEKIFLNLNFEDLMACQLMNKSSKQILDNPMFWIKKLMSKGLSKPNQDGWINAIQITKNTKLAEIIALYLKKVLHKNRFIDVPCYIDTNTVERISQKSFATQFSTL